MEYELKLGYQDLKNVKKLFQEYSLSLGVDLTFQSYDEELQNLPGKYALPQGRLYLLYVDGHAVGVGALRYLKEDACEFKRLYVKPVYRGHHFGEIIMKQLIQDAKEIGYKEGYLDTLSTLTSAVHLYEKLKFKKIDAYYENPLENVEYFCKML